MYTVGEVSKILGISRDTIKFYEKKVLVKPNKRLDNSSKVVRNLSKLPRCSEYRKCLSAALSLCLSYIYTVKEKCLVLRKL